MDYQTALIEQRSANRLRQIECFRERETEEQEQWELNQLKGLPFRWARAARKWHKIKAKELGIQAANLWLLRLGEKWRKCAIPLDAGPDELKQLAVEQANKLFDLAAIATDIPQLRHFQAESCARYGIETPPASVGDDAAITMMTDWEWWLPRLRRAAARSFENVARELGFVNLRAGLYCSNETFQGHAGRKKRNRQMLEETIAINEDGDEFTVAELSDGSVSNPANRRAELMNKVRGMSDFAKLFGHDAVFAVVTCPSRMHVFKIDQATQKPIPNPKFDGTTPKQAQEHLQELWQCVRSAFDRERICYYGMRTAEANHDGTPHWNLLFFVPPMQRERAKEIVRSYALADSPNEPGAQQRRVRFEDIDPAKGDPVAYIAKYIAKGTDAAGLQSGLFGDDAATATQRLQAWASTHGIRQFQFYQVPPAGLWREMRKIPAEKLKGAPPEFLEAWTAAQKQGSDRADFCRFWQAIGGKVKRVKDYLVALHKEEAEGTDRYGEPLPAKPAGLCWKPTETVFESVRHTWEIVSKWGRRLSSPWTRVNNCTRTNSVHAERQGFGGISEGISGPDGTKRKGNDPSSPAKSLPDHTRTNGAFGYGFQTA